MNDIDGVALGVFLFFFLLVTVMGFLAARWRRAASLDSLDEWGLGGRSFGTFIAWFLIGGDIYTAYTFIAVPALLYAGNAIGFFAVPYTIILYPIIFVFLPRLWSVSHRRRYVTPADFVQGGSTPSRSDSRWRSPESWRRCRTSRCSSSASRRCSTSSGSGATRTPDGSRRTCRCSSRSRCSRPTRTRRASGLRRSSPSSRTRSSTW